jgi:hypothetical protein
MNLNFANKLMIATCCVLFSALNALGQGTTQPANYIHVNAPYAQKIVVAEMSKHSNEIQKIGLHAVPPGATDNVIIAANLAAKIGKKSSPTDLQIVAIGKPHALRDEKGHFYDLSLPIADRDGKDIGDGFLVMEVPFANATSEEQALKIGAIIRDELQRQISSRDALYR